MNYVPRLVHISHSNNVQLSGVRLINSPFWTTHLYKCNHIKLLNLYIFSPEKPVKAPSTDAIDIDVCSNVLVKNCYMSVNDDAIALKGGKGPLGRPRPEQWRKLPTSSSKIVPTASATAPSLVEANPSTIAILSCDTTAGSLLLAMLPHRRKTSAAERSTSTI